MLICIVLLLWLLIATVVGVAQYIKFPKPPNGWTYKEYKFYYRVLSHGRFEARRGTHRVREYVEAGQRLKAIREIRLLTGCSLADAKEAVEQLEISVRRQREAAEHRRYS